MGHLFRIEGQAFEVWLAGRAGHYSLYVGEGAAVPVSRDAALDGAVVASSGDTLFVHLEGTAYEVGFVDPIARFGAAGAFAASDVARAPMPGSVVSVSVVVGQAVGASCRLPCGRLGMGWWRRFFTRPGRILIGMRCWRGWRRRWRHDAAVGVAVGYAVG
jgi:hypothetical protein